MDKVEVPDVCHAELANVVWQGVRAGHLDLDEALAALDAAGGLVDESIGVMTPWHEAVMLSADGQSPGLSRAERH